MVDEDAPIPRVLLRDVGTATEPGLSLDRTLHWTEDGRPRSVPVTPDPQLGLDVAVLLPPRT